MNNETVDLIVQQIASRVGLAVAVKLTKTGEGQTCECFPVDGHPNESFAVCFHLRWRIAEAIFVPGRFAARLIQQMGKATEEGKDVFAAFTQGLEAKRIRIQMRINGTEVNPGVSDSWPPDWTRLELALRTPPMVIEEGDTALHERLLLELVVPFFGMMAALIGVEENEPATTGEVEGRRVQTLSTRYERKKINREACIQLKGTRCCVCDFDFAETYGPLGIGYIEVHHLNSIASIGGEYRLNIATDLVPICSNCHAMAHREEPPIAVERLISLVQERKGAATTTK